MVNNEIINPNHREIKKIGGMRYISIPVKFLKKNKLDTGNIIDISKLKKVERENTTKK